MLSTRSILQSMLKVLLMRSVMIQTLNQGMVLTIYSENDKISGYCIDIVKDSLPNGYVVVKFRIMNLLYRNFRWELAFKIRMR